MAQVNSEPGVSQVPPTVSVPVMNSEVGAGSAKTAAKAVAVPYAQAEPGITVNTKRS